MNYTFPLWVTNLSVISSIIGLIVTCFLLWEAKKIRKSFMRKARIPEIVEDLDQISKELFKHLQAFTKESRNAQQKIQNAKGLLESILPKMDGGHKAKINSFINCASGMSEGEFSEDDCWNGYTELSRLIAYFKQLEKDTKWEQ